MLPGGANERVLAGLIGKRFEPAAQELVARNLARWQEGCYTLLTPLQAYALETRPPKRLTTARLRAARFYAQLASTMNDLLQPIPRRRIAGQLAPQTEEQSQEEVERRLTDIALTTFDAERINLLSAVEWAFAEQAWEVVRTLVENLNMYLNLRSLWGDMVAVVQMAIEAARQEGSRHAEGIALTNLGSVYRVQGELDKALGVCQQSLAILLEIGDHLGAITVLCQLGRILHGQGDLDTAFDHFARAFALALGLHSKPVLDTVDRIIDLAKGVTAAGKLMHVAQFGQRLVEVVEQRKAQEWTDETLLGVAEVCQQVFALIASMGCLANGPAKEQHTAKNQALEWAQEIDAATQGKWSLEAWIKDVLAKQEERRISFSAFRRVAVWLGKRLGW